MNNHSNHHHHHNNHHNSSKHCKNHHDAQHGHQGHLCRLSTIPPLPPIKGSPPAIGRRLKPLSIEEYEHDFNDSASDLTLIERIYYGGLENNQLRAALWPYLFGLVKKRGRFKQVTNFNGRDNNEANIQNGHRAKTNGHSQHTSNGHSLPSSNGYSFPMSNGHSPLTNGLSQSLTNGRYSTSPDSHYQNGDSSDTLSSSSTEIPNGKPTMSMTEELKREKTNYIYVEHEDNVKKWRELEKLYYTYQSQWESILPDQELRFTTFRERKSLIERDVIRSDRSHPFYADNSQNLSTFTKLLMTYMMYDFDIGYLQGMSDLAAPILYMFNGNLVKSFWVFVEVMKLFRRNFEYSQKTIHFQLNCLLRLIKITDPKFAHYLYQNESSNCFFAFRFIVCQFKRELMKGEHQEENYSKVLSLWDTIWSVQRRHDLLAKSKIVHTYTIGNGRNSNYNRNHKGKHRHHHQNSSPHHPIQADVPRLELSETEKFVLSLCLSLIRRERNQILLEQLDATEIHQHFINPDLANDLDNFIESAYHIYQFMNTDCDIQSVVKGANEPIADSFGLDIPFLGGGAGNSPRDDTADSYDLLKDYLIISPSSYNTSHLI